MDFIEVYDDVLTADLCRAWVDAFEKSEHRQPGETGGGYDPNKKRSTDIVVTDHSEYRELLQPVIQATTRQMLEYFRKYHLAMIGPLGLTAPDPETGELTAITDENFERVGVPMMPRLLQHLFRVGTINAQKYEQQSGGYTYWHSEVFPEQPDNEALHRVLLFMFYLNDVAEGGETAFYYQQRSVQPQAGRMVIAPAYFTHSHCGHVPLSGDKYILTSWVLFNRAEQLYAS